MNRYSMVQVFAFCLVLVTDTVTMKERSLLASCRNGSQLIQVSGYDRPYFDTKSVPLLIHSLKNSPIFCMWKQNCAIKIIRRGMKMKKWFRKNMKCLKNGTTIYDLISNETSSECSKKSSISSLDHTVIARSHKNFPWNYEHACDNTSRVLEFKTEQKHIQKSKLAIKVLWSEVSLNDHLSIQYGKTSQNIIRGSGFQYINITQLENVKLQLTLSKDQKSDKGFLLCMKIVDLADQNEAVCDAALDHVTVEPLKGGEKKKRNRKGKGGKKGKRGKKRNKRRQGGKRKGKRQGKRKRKRQGKRKGKKGKRRREQEKNQKHN